MARASLLLQALRLNAWFSGLSAVFLLLAAPWIAAQLGLADSLLIYIVGGLLVVFSLQLANIVRTGVIRTPEIIGIIAGDLAWVIGSIALVAMFYANLTIPGLLLVDAVAIAVLFFAVQQIRGLRVLHR